MPGLKDYGTWLSQHTEKEIKSIFGHYPITYTEWSEKFGGVATPSATSPWMVAPTAGAPVTSTTLSADEANLKTMNDLRALMGQPPLGMEEYQGGQGGVVPPFPSTPPPQGYVWNLETDTITGERYWAPSYKGFGAGTTRKTMPEGLYATREEASVAAPEGYIPVQDPDTGYWSTQIDPKYQKQPPGTYKTYAEAEVAAPQGFRVVQLSDGYWGFERVPEISPYQQQDIALQQQQLDESRRQADAQRTWLKEQEAGRLAAEKQQRLAQLGAQPISWLQYAAESQQPPVIQPWMLPLQERDYGWQVGQPIPGYTPENMTGMPTLTTPSRQYQARMGPTAEQKYLGYQQAQTGALPEETQWRLWSHAPPSGQFTGLRR